MNQPKEYRGMHIASVFVYLVYVYFLAVQIGKLFVVAAGEGVFPLLVMALTPVAGYLLADFTSGFVHFMGDTFGNEKTPVVGKAFIYAFREHHTDQKAITRHDFFYTNGNNCLVSLPVMLTMYHLVPDAWLSNLFVAFLYTTLFFLVISIFFTNQIHKWAHQETPNVFARVLQRYGLILTPGRHKLHHIAPYTSDFCITTAWLNPLLNKLRFFSFAKYILAKIPLMPKVDA